LRADVVALEQADPGRVGAAEIEGHPSKHLQELARVAGELYSQKRKHRMFVLVVGRTAWSRIELRPDVDVVQCSGPSLRWRIAADTGRLAWRTMH